MSVAGKNLLISILAVLSISGCDWSSGREGRADKQAKSETALYLPDGVGIDFGIKPASDQVIQDATGRFRVLEYELSTDLSSEDVSLQISALMASAGYSKRINDLRGYEQNISYRLNANEPILFRVKKDARNGLKKIIVVVVSWRL